jgi:ribosomal protein S18 acetylase RimI-like enzyme
MSEFAEFDDARQRRIYEYVERRGAVEPETVRKSVLVHPESGSKPARSGGAVEPSVSMSAEEFDAHLSALESEGYLEEVEGKLRVALPLEDNATTVPLEDEDATVRPARQEDIDGIVGVVETVAAAEEYVVAARLAREVSRDDVLLRRNERQDRVFFVATVDEDVVGWLHVGGERAPQMGHTATLTVGVLEDYRDSSIGSTLMAYGLEWAADRGYLKVYQNLPASNERAIAFLEDAGWSVESTREGHYRIGDELVDEVQLAIWLDE